MYKFLLLGIQLALDRCYLQIFQDMAFGGSAQKVSFRELIDSVVVWKYMQISSSGSMRPVDLRVKFEPLRDGSLFMTMTGSGKK